MEELKQQNFPFEKQPAEMPPDSIPDKMPEDVIPDEVPRKDGPGGETGKSC